MNIPIGTFVTYNGHSVKVLQGPFQKGAWECYIVHVMLSGRRITVHSNELKVLEKVK